jgi:hypothetical protein
LEFGGKNRGFVALAAAKVAPQARIGPCCGRTSHPPLCKLSAQPPPAANNDLSPPQHSKARQAQPRKHEHEQKASRHLLTLFFPSPILLPRPIALLLNTSPRHRRASGFAIVTRSFVHFPAGLPPPRPPRPPPTFPPPYTTPGPRPSLPTFLVRSYPRCIQLMSIRSRLPRTLRSVRLQLFEIPRSNL